MHGKTKGFKRGRKTALSQTSERALVDILVQMSDLAYALDPDSIRLVVRHYVVALNLKKPFQNNAPGID